MSCDCACELCIGHKGGHSEWQLSDQIYHRFAFWFTVHIFGIWRRLRHAHSHRHTGRKLTPRGADIALFAEFGFRFGKFCLPLEAKRVIKAYPAYTLLSSLYGLRLYAHGKYPTPSSQPPRLKC